MPKLAFETLGQPYEVQHLLRSRSQLHRLPTLGHRLTAHAQQACHTHIEIAMCVRNLSLTCTFHMSTAKISTYDPAILGSPSNGVSPQPDEACR